jgi:hypothetical protein
VGDILIAAFQSGIWGRRDPNMLQDIIGRGITKGPHRDGKRGIFTVCNVNGRGIK